MRVGVGLAALVLLGCTESQAPASGSRPAYPPFTDVVVVGCYDGDTCTVSLPGLPAVFGERLPIRLAGIDTPEIHGKCEQEKRRAIEARDVLLGLIRQASRIELHEPGRDKYFRLDVRMVADGQDLGAELVRLGLAVPYFGGRKEHDWCP